MYKLQKDAKSSELSGVLKDGNIGIPLDPANTDYQDYLAWVAEGNTPEPSDD